MTASTSGIILMDLGARGWSLLRSLTQKMVLTCPSGWGYLSGSFWRFWLLKGLEGGGRLEQGVSLGLCHPNTVEETDLQNCRAHCLFIDWLVGSYWFIGVTYVIHTNSLLIKCAVNICFHSLCCHFFNSMFWWAEVSHLKVVLTKF